MRRTAIFLALCASASGQRLDLSTLDKLAARAKQSALVTLDEDKLRLAAGFLSPDDPKQEKAKSLISGLKGVYVRTFEFGKKGEYSMADIDPIRAQLRGPGWSQIVSVQGEETAEVYLHSTGKEVGGLAVIAGEAEELAVVNIVGPINISDLTKLGGSFGIPNIESKIGGGGGPKPPRKPGAPPPAPKPPRPDEENDD